MVCQGTKHEHVANIHTTVYFIHITATTDENRAQWSSGERVVGEKALLCGRRKGFAASDRRPGGSIPHCGRVLTRETRAGDCTEVRERKAVAVALVMVLADDIGSNTSSS